MPCNILLVIQYKFVKFLVWDFAWLFCRPADEFFLQLYIRLLSFLQDETGVCSMCEVLRLWGLAANKYTQTLNPKPV